MARGLDRLPSRIEEGRRTAMSTDVRLTPVAATKLKTIHPESSKPIVRLYVAGQGCCSYRFGLAFEEAPGSDDTVVGADDVLVLVAQEDRVACEGAVVDFVQTEQGEGFTVRTPGSAAGCTCGGRR
jgi:iron-sulfur cluster insertion protein